MAPSRYESYDDLLTDDPYMSLLDPEAIMNEEEDEGSDELNFDSLDDNYMNRSDRGGNSDGEGENAAANEKEDDEVMEGDIVDGKWETVVKYFNSGKRMAASDSSCIVCFTMVGVVLCTRHLLEPQRNAADFRSEVGWTQAGRDSPNLHGARHL